MKIRQLRGARKQMYQKWQHEATILSYDLYWSTPGRYTYWAQDIWDISQRARLDYDEVARALMRTQSP